MSTLEKDVREFLDNPVHSYARLAQFLDIKNPRTDGVRWTKNSAYHFCRTRGISSPRTCRSQPAAGITQRTRSRQSILCSLIHTLHVTGTSILSLAPFKTNDIARLSGFPLHTVISNWLNRPGFSRHLASSLRNAFQTLSVTADC